MHALRGTRRLLAGIALAAFTIGFIPGSAMAKPWPNAKVDNYKLFAKSFSNFAANRVSLGLSTRGEVGVDSTGSGTVGGGYWPRGTADEYVFNSGLQIAGIIQGAKSASNPWGGDTTGAFFFDPKGTTRNGAEVTPIYNSNNPDDVANWPAAGLVPQGDAGEALFDPLLRGTISASQGDEWWVTWEGDPAFISGRTHPLGVLAEYRIMGWNYPSGNEDLAYVIVTFYNITSTNAADYTQHRPAMRSILLDQAAKFQSLNNAKFGITLPAGGYTIGPMYAAFAADMDVGTGTNFISVNLPFAMGYSYQSNFYTAPGWIFDPSIFGSPFFAGVGFIGTKYLKGPTGPGKIQLFSGNTNGALGFSDPGTGLQLFRYLSGGVIPGLDSPCTGAYVPLRDHICFIRHTTGVDTRHFQSSTALTVAPGQSASIVIAYIFAAPVLLPGFTATSAVEIDPGEPLITAHPDSMLAHLGATGKPGVPRVDSMTGFLAYNGQTDLNTDGSEYQPVQSDFKVLPKSLLGKALVAQSVFDNHFLLPFAPEKPAFFLIPGDKQVTILWKPSPTDQASPGATGDAYFTIAGSATTALPGGGTTPNSLYDPNYRRFDVEGYRIYRGRTDAPNALKLLAQFDYAGTVFSDYGGNVQNGNCAPELGTFTDCPKTFAVTTPGVTSTVHQDYPINGSLVQVKYGDRDKLANGKTVTFHADTLLTGDNAGFPAPSDNGVPFVFLDKAGAAGCTICGVYNGVKYFYSVTAFDVNSVTSAPSSLESPRSTKSVVVGGPGANYVSEGSVAVKGPYGRDVLLTDKTVATLDPATGKFNKKAPPSNAATVALSAFVTQVLKAGDVAVTLDSIIYVSSGDGGTTVTNQWFSSGWVNFSMQASSAEAAYTNGSLSSANFTALTADPTLAAAYGGGAGYNLPAVITVQSPSGYTTGNRGRGCINGGTSTAGTGYFGSARQCIYGGPRWFVGDAETKSNPSGDNADAFDGLGTPVTLSNAGELAGVSRIFWPTEYFNTSSSWRRVSGSMGGFISAADYRMYWGAAGHVDSVIDLTHNTVVPFSTDIKASWGILNNSAVPATTAYDGRAVLTYTDIGCVAPFKGNSTVGGSIACSGTAAALSQTAIPGPVSICATGDIACNKTAAVMAGQGFVIYLKGEVFVIELAGGLPASGAAWTMRDYTGGVVGGKGVAGDFGPYVFHPDPVRPFTAPGLTYKFAVSTTNALVATTEETLSKVHTVPDPYYVTSAYDRTATTKVIKFVNLPTDATIRIYTASGILVRVLHNTTTVFQGIVDWDVRNRSNQFVSSGVYFYTVESGGISKTYRLTIVNYASNIQ